MAKERKVDVGIHKKGCKLSIKPDFHAAFDVGDDNRHLVTFAVKDFDNATGKLTFDVGVGVTGTRVYGFTNSEALLTADTEMRVSLTSAGSMEFLPDLSETSMREFEVGTDDRGFYFVILPLTWFRKQPDNLLAR